MTHKGFSTIVISTLLLSLSSSVMEAKKKKDPRLANCPPNTVCRIPVNANSASTEEMQHAYALGTQYVYSVLKAPSTATFQPVGDAVYDPDGRIFFTKHLLTVKFFVDAQNSFGGMMREYWVCGVTRGDKRVLKTCLNLTEINNRLWR
jgi:hypothetical protein